MRYLIRGGSNPLDKYIPDYLAKRDIIGSNSGNMLYLYSVCRSVYSDEVSYDLDMYKAENGKYTDKDIAMINQKYDAYICPLADAFRKDFAPKLLQYASFFKKLTIPVVITGVGLRAPKDVKMADAAYPFDDAVKTFVAEALKHGACLGLRGDITGQYLKKLGFKEEVDYTTIGCPSLYSKGLNLPEITRPVINRTSKIIVNFNFSAPEAENWFLDGVCRDYPNSVYIGQHMDDFYTFYYGLTHHETLTNIPNSMSHFMISGNRTKFYVSAKQWYDNARGYDLSIGHRLHGNVASLIAGVPSVLILTDARSAELSNYHAIPFIEGKKIIDQKLSLEDVVAQVDFSKMNKVHERNFDHYLDFLEKNGIKHVYKGNKGRTTTKLDEDIQNPALLKPYIECSPLEAIARQTTFLNKKYDAEFTQIKNQLKALK